MADFKLYFGGPLINDEIFDDSITGDVGSTLS
jgi:hypothetical protein